MSTTRTQARRTKTQPKVLPEELRDRSLVPRPLTSTEIDAILKLVGVTAPIQPDDQTVLRQSLESLTIPPRSIAALVQYLTGEGGFSRKAINYATLKTDLAPQRLSRETINWLISDVNYGEHQTRNFAVVKDVQTASQKASLISELSGMELTPLGLPMLKDEIRRKFQSSLVHANSTVGILAGESFGSPLSQMILNSKHTAGASRAITSGVDRITELLYVRFNIKMRSSSIFFKDRVTFDQVIFDKKSELVGVMLNMLVSDVTIDTPESIYGSTEPWWYDLYSSLIRSDFRTSNTSPNYIMRLKMNLANMITYSVTMEEVARAIESSPIKIKNEKSSPQMVYAVYSPMYEGIIDIYPIERTIQLPELGSVAVDQMALTFLYAVVVPSLDKIQIKGINGIRNVYPISTPVLELVRSQERVEGDNNQWLLRYNKNRMSLTGLSPNYLIDLIEAVNQASGQGRVEVLPIPDEARDDYMLIQMPNRDKPLAYLGSIIKADIEANQKLDADRRRRGAMLETVPVSEIGRTVNYITMDSDGSNLELLLARDEIDATRTISNDVNEIVRLLGIEAARNFLIWELLRTFQFEDMYIDPRHVTVVADFIVNSGRLLPVSYAGVQVQQTGAIAKATMERALDVYMESGAFGRLEEIRNVSTAISTGTRANIGTGAIDVLTDPVQEKRYLAELRQSSKKENINTFRTGLLQLVSSVGLNSPVGPDTIPSAINPTFNAQREEDELFGLPGTVPLSSIGPNPSGSAISPSNQTVIGLPTGDKVTGPLPKPVMSNLIISAASSTTIVQGPYPPPITIQQTTIAGPRTVTLPSPSNSFRPPSLPSGPLPPPLGPLPPPLVPPTTGAITQLVPPVPRPPTKYTVRPTPPADIRVFLGQ